MSETSERRKDAHDLRKLVEHRMERSAGRCWLAPAQMREYGLAPADVEEWAREAGWEIQLPLFPGGLYELRKAEP